MVERFGSDLLEETTQKIQTSVHDRTPSTGLGKLLTSNRVMCSMCDLTQIRFSLKIHDTVLYTSTSWLACIVHRKGQGSTFKVYVCHLQRLGSYAN